MSWRQMIADKLTTPQEAVKAVRSGDRVVVHPFTTTPFTLCQALYERRKELQNVTIVHPAGLFPWVREEADLQSFHVINNYATPFDRDAVNKGLVDYLPIGVWKEAEIPPGAVPEPDFYLVPVSPPDKHGYCSFGTRWGRTIRRCRSCSSRACRGARPAPGRSRARGRRPAESRPASRRRWAGAPPAPC